jgi:hypothetical protein
MNFSNYLGAAGTSYSNVQNRGFELSPSEYFTISADRRTLSFQNSNSTVADQLRILTTTVPEPSALMMAAVAGMAFTMKRHRSWGNEKGQRKGVRARGGRKGARNLFMNMS